MVSEFFSNHPEILIFRPAAKLNFTNVGSAAAMIRFTFRYYRYIFGLDYFPNALSNQNHGVMKTKTMLVVLFFFTGITFESICQPDPVSDLAKTDSALLMHKFQKSLKGALVFNGIVSTLEITGAHLFMIGNSKNSTLAAVGFLVAFPAMEMSKYSPIPLTKAKKALVGLKPFWQDSLQYCLLMKHVTTAKRLSYAAMSTAFIGQAMFVFGAISRNQKSATTLMVCSSVMVGLSFSLAISSTVKTYLARKTLGKSRRDLSLDMTKDGLSIVYRIPGR